MVAPTIALVRERHYIYVGDEYERYPVEQSALGAVGQLMSDGRAITGAFDLQVIDGGKPPEGRFACTTCGVLYPTVAALMAHRESGE